jgi:Putative Flp pilus-assembly TadE/G-like
VHRRLRRSTPIARSIEVDSHTRSAGDAGSIAAFVLVMFVVLFAVAGLVIDGGSELSAHQAATDEAEQAARRGAAQLSDPGLRSGVIAVDPSQAVKAAVDFTVVAGHRGTATVSEGVVAVEVHYRIPTAILGIIGIRTLPVSATASAVDVAGVTAGSVEGT